MTEPTLAQLSSEPADAAEPTLNSDPTEPTEPMLSAEPVDPIDSTEPCEAIESTDPREPRDHNEATSVLDAMRGLYGPARTLDRLVDHPPSESPVVAVRWQRTTNNLRSAR